MSEAAVSITDAMGYATGAASDVISPRHAYQRAAEKIQKVADAELIHINLAVPTAVTTVLGALTRIRELRPALAKVLSAAELTAFDELETYAYALLHVHMRWNFAVNPPEALPELMQKALATRDLLVTSVSTLAKFGLLDASVLQDLKGPVGYRNVAVDLGGMAEMLRANWNVVGQKTALQLSDLDAAEELTKDLVGAIAQKEQRAAMAAALSVERQRAYTLFAATWNEVRRAVSYLRWHQGDADAIAPSLHAGKNFSKRKRRNVQIDLPAVPEMSISTNS